MDSRSDIFSLGVVVYEMLAGRRPFASASDGGLIMAILRDDPPPLRALRHQVSTAVEAILDRALAKDPAARYPDAGTMRADLATALARLTRTPDAVWRRPTVRAGWARDVAIPEFERLDKSGRSLAAVRLAREAELYAPARSRGRLSAPIST